jgi:hypothetical protein
MQVLDVKRAFVLKYGLSLREWKGKDGRKEGIQERLHTAQRIAAWEVTKKKRGLIW